MQPNLTAHRRRVALMGVLIGGMVLALMGRLGYLMLFRADHYGQMAQDLHERERTIKAARGRILDANGRVLADNRRVCTISVIHSQIEDEEVVAEALSSRLDLDLKEVKKKVEKKSSREIIKTNVEYQLGEEIRSLNLAGVKVDEDYKRYYPYGSLASKVMGFTGGDNQGIIGLEVKYESELQGKSGVILTMTDARGVELKQEGESRIEPVPGKDLQISLDVNIQQYAQQLAYQVLEQKNAMAVSILVMNPQNGEIMAMVNAPEFDLNDPFTLDQNLKSDRLKEEAAARPQARIDSGIQTIVGGNKYRLEKEDPIDILEIDNTAVREQQIERLKALKARRNQKDVDAALDALTHCVETKEGNLLDLSVKAAAVGATLGEISYACEKVVGRYKATIRTISGVYSSETKKDASFAKACELCEEFAKLEGRQPRVMIAKMGQDGHDRGAKVVATGFADVGFDVDMGPLFQTPAEAAREAVENDVHAGGVSSLAAGHKTLVPQIIEELKKLGREDIMVFAGGVIPVQDYDFLYRAGVAAIFGPGTSVAKCACDILNLLLEEIKG